MKIINRIKRLVVSPREEWIVIAGEKYDIIPLLRDYLLVLLCVPMVALVLGWEFVGKTETYYQLTTSTRGWDIGIHKALVYLVTTFITVFASASVIDRMSPAFRVEKNYGKTLKLIVYSWTPVLLSGIFYLVPALSFMIIPGFVYAFVLLYHGLDPLIKTPAPAKTVYFISAVAVVLCCYVLTYMIIKAFVGVLWVNTTNLMPGNFVL